ncbi:MAG: radical SAM protein [Bacteroidota bacterium]|nr:radical SAM protein [Bacteroidota bacterium]
MYRHLFGPIRSRRLGVSLGIDLTPGKTCSFNCVYCECGRTLVLTDERREYVPTEEVIAELKSYLSTHPRLDSITFSGSGEPTLHNGIGNIIAFLKDEFPSYRVTVLTNSSLLHREEVRADLARADLVIPSLDAVSEEAFLRLNRPFHGLTAALMIEGIRTFCENFSGAVWLEVFIVPGVNDTPSEITTLRETIRTLRVDKVQLNTLDRPGAVSWVEPVSPERLRELASMLGPNVEIISSGRGATPVYTGLKEARERLISELRNHSRSVAELEHTLKLPRDEIVSILQQLMDEDRVRVFRDERGILYQAWD